MKQVWKRTMSLALSGVLLLSNVPVQAWATEEPAVQEIPAAVAQLANEVVAPIKVNGNAGGVTIGEGKLTLTGANVESVESTYDGILTVELAEGTKAVINGALSAVKGIRITGKGILEVGSISAGEDLEIDGTIVKVGRDKDSDETKKELIKVKNSISVSNEVHVVTASGHNAVVFENGTGKVNGGHWRVAKDGDFIESTDAADCGYFELVSLDHLTGENSHVMYCKCSTPTKVIFGEHTPAYECEGPKLVCVCDSCGNELGTLTVEAPEDLTWDGQPKVVELSQTFVPEMTCSVKYYKDSVAEENEQEAVEPGFYIAVVTVEGLEEQLELHFTINKKALKDLTVTLTPAQVIYDGQLCSLPQVTVEDAEMLMEGTDYEVAFTRDGKAVGEEGRTNAGEIKVTVTGKGNYTGTVEKIFTIQQADATADLFECNMPADLTYNGNPEKATVKVSNTVQGMGDISLKYYRNGEAAEPVAAGTYEVAVCVAGNGNYKQAEMKDAAWTFTIAPVAVTDTDGQAVPAQTVVASHGAMAIQKPSFTGINGEKIVPENVSYQLEGTEGELTYEQLLNKLKTLPAGTTAKIGYTVEADGNYTGTITGEMTVNIVDLEFTVGEKPATGENAVTIIDEEKRVYGQEGIVTVKDIRVTAGDKTDAAPQFTVLYQIGSGDKKSQPDAGNNTFYVMYSGTIDGVAYENIEVCQGNVMVEKRPAAPNVTAVTGLTDGEQDQGKEMLTVAAVEGEKIKYSVNDSSWTENVPTVKESGVYTIKYRVDESKNIIGKDDFDPVKVVVAPYITATYGDTLEKVQGTVSTSQGTWRFDTQVNPLTTKVGPVNETGNEFYMSFMPKNEAEATVTEHPVKIFVEPARTRVSVEVKDRYLPYADGKKVEAAVTVKNAENNEVIASGEYTAVCTNITNTQDQEVINPGKAKITVQPKANYVFENDTADLSKEYIVYDNTAVKLVDAWTYADYDNDDMSAAEFPTGKEVKEALDKALDEELGEDKADYPATKRKYYDFLMKDNSAQKYVYDQMYWPDDGLIGSVAYINDDADNTDTYKVYAMYTVDSDNTQAGTVIELTETKGATPGINEYKKNAKSISVNLKHYAAVCIALKENTEKEYSVTAKSEDTKTGTVSFKVGTSTSAKTAQKGDTITVTVSPKSGYELSRLNYTYNDGSKDVTTAIEKNSSGKYTFEMPAASVVINAKFSKKAANPSSGDTSNIQLWVTMLAASGIAIVAVILFWLKKRKK